MDPALVQHGRSRLPGLHPRRRHLPGRAGRPDRRWHQPLHRHLAGRPGLVQLEANVLDWFRDWMGFPPTTRGLFTTGGSMSIFNAILCARERQLGTEIRSGVLYTSTQAHASVIKSAKLAGIFPDRVGRSRSTTSFACGSSARPAIDADRPRGCGRSWSSRRRGRPTPAPSTRGAMADLCNPRGLWHHVDGAYGAFFHLVEPLRPLLAGLSRADSLTPRPAQGPVLALRHRGAPRPRRLGPARRCMRCSASYLPPPWTLSSTTPLSTARSCRGFPGLRVWLTIKTFGAARMRAAIAEKQALAVAAAQRLAARARNRTGCGTEALAIRLPARSNRHVDRRSKTGRPAGCWNGSTPGAR